MPKLLARQGNNSVTYSIVVVDGADTALSTDDWAALPASRLKDVLSRTFTTTSGPAGEEAAAVEMVAHLASEGFDVASLVWENPIIPFLRATSLGGDVWGITIVLGSSVGDKLLVKLSLSYSASE